MMKFPVISQIISKLCEKWMKAQAKIICKLPIITIVLCFMLIFGSSTLSFFIFKLDIEPDQYTLKSSTAYDNYQIVNQYSHDAKFSIDYVIVTTPQSVSSTSFITLVNNIIQEGEQ
eukprot:Pgem_evm1s2775